MVKNVHILDILLQKHYVSVLFLAYIFLLEVVGGIPRPPQFKDTSVSSSFHRERRWLIEKVRPLNMTPSRDSLKHKKYVQLWKIRQALATGRHEPFKNLSKRSSGRDYLDRIASFIKEKEDASLRPAGSAKVVFILDGSGKIGNEDLNSYRLFVKKVYKNLNIPTRGITFGLLECGSKRYTQRNILPRKIQNSKVLDLTLDKLIPVSGSCELGKSLEILNKNVFMKMPSGSPKAVVVVMAGKSVDDVSNAAKELSRLSVRVVTIGVGGQADMKQLATIADSSLYAFKVPVIKYLPAMSGTVVGFLNGVTDSKTLNANVVVSDPSVIQKGKHSGYYKEENSLDANEIEEAPYTDNDLLQGLPPILDQLDGDKSAIDSWISALGGESTQHDYSYPGPGVHPSQRPSTTGNVGTRPTRTSYEVGTTLAAAPLNNWNDGGFAFNPTLAAENPFHNVNSINDSPQNELQDSGSQVPMNPLPNNNGSAGQASSGQTGGKVTTQGSSANSAMSPSTASTNGSAQGGVSQGQGATGEVSASPATAANPNPVGGNQGNGKPSEGSPGSNGAGSSVTSENPNQMGGGQVKGVSGEAPAVSSGVVTPGATGNPDKAGSNQVSGSIPQTTTGGVANPSSSGPGGTGGTGGTGETGGTSGGASSPPGVVPVIQTPLLSIPVLPIQTIPIQALPSIQTAGSENSQKLQPQSPNNTNQREGNGETIQTPTPTTSRAVAAPNEGNQEGKNRKGPEAPHNPSTSPGNQNPSGSANSRPEKLGNGSNQAPSSLKPTPVNRSSAKLEPTSAPAETLAKSGTSGNPNPTTPPSGTSNKEVHSGKPDGSKNKPISTTAIKGGAPDGESSPTKPSNKESSQSHQQQPIVLCQIVCGPGCCPLISTTKPTVPTTKETTTLKTKETTKPTKEAPPEVLAGPPIPIHYPQRPGWFPQNLAPLPMPPSSLPFGTDPGSVSIHPQSNMYMTLPPATSAPKISSFRKTDKHDIFAGQCEDYHPDCPSFLLSGLCDQPNPFLEVFNVREVCMRSCGVCNSFVKHGRKDTFELHKKEKKPEDIGFPEYSRKFLKRNLRVIHMPEELQR